MGLLDLSHVPTHNEPRGYDPEGDFFKSSKRVDDGTKPGNVNLMKSITTLCTIDTTAPR